MKCLIIYNAFLKSDKFFDFAFMLQEAATEYGHEANIIQNSDILNLVSTNISENVFFKNDKPNYVIFTDKDIYLARLLEAQGIPVYNSSHVIEHSDDKIKTYQMLAQAGVPVPKTIIVPNTFGLPATLDRSFFDQSIQELGFPMIVKEAFGSFGEQVYLSYNRCELERLIVAHGHKPLMLQQFIETSYGRDLRVQVVGNKVIAAMQRTSENDFRANITTGGKMLPYDLNARESDIAIRASQAIGAHFSGIDLLFGFQGLPVVCEVNANAHIRNLLNCTGVNAANDIIDHIHHDLQRGTKS